MCRKATLQIFRTRLLLNEAGAELFEYSVRVCRQAGVLSSPKIRAAIDTSPILGRGAVKDTYNLVADGMARLLRILAAFESPVLGPGVEECARRQDLSRYVTGTSLKRATCSRPNNLRQRRLARCALLDVGLHPFPLVNRKAALGVRHKLRSDMFTSG